MTKTCDILIIGSGPAGYAAALEASVLGRDVVLVEKDLVGGTCLNRGCIPTKLFLGASRAVSEIKAQSRMRLGQGSFVLDLAALQKRKASLLGATRQSMAKKLEAAGVRLIHGLGELAGPDQVVVRASGGNGQAGQGARLIFDRLILALGSRPVWPKALEPDGEHILLSDQILEIDEVPASLAVIGAGAIGLEMAQFFQRVGAQVTLLEAAERIAPTEDPEISSQLAAMLKRQGIDVRSGVAVSGLQQSKGEVIVHLAEGQTLNVGKVLVAVGRGPNAALPGLDLAGASFSEASLSEKGALTVDASLRLTDRIYAVGDCNGQVLLAHAAEHQGRFAARHAAGAVSGPYRPGSIPFCIYGDPEAMRVGLTAGKAAAQGLEHSVSRAMLAANPVAQAAAAPHGLVKVVWSGERVVGVSAVGHGVLHFVSAAVIMVDQGWSRERVEDMVFAHPTLDETLRQALLAPQEPR